MSFAGSKVLFNCFKYKRRLDYVTTAITIRWKSTGLKILFFGTDNFSLPSLQKLNEDRLNNGTISSIDVVTSFKNPKNPVRAYSEDKKLNLFKWPLSSIRNNCYDLGIVVSFGHLIPEKLILSFSLGIINVHASLLPQLRGAAPVIHALKNGHRKTGVTIMKIEPKHFDIGDILAQTEVEIHEDMLMPELYNTLAEEGAKLLASSINHYPDILKDARPQDESQATYAPKITPEFCEIAWSKLTAVQVYNLYRALYSYKPLTTKWQNQNVKLIEMRRSPHIDESKMPGFIEFRRSDKCLRIFCKDGSSVDVTRLCVEGKKTLSAVDFNNGYLKGCVKTKIRFSFIESK